MKERINVFANIKGRKTRVFIGVIIKEPNEKIDLETIVETYFEKNNAYGRK